MSEAVQVNPIPVPASTPIEVVTPGRYRLSAKSHLPKQPGGEPELLEIGAEVYFAGLPGPHMEPLDEAARAAKARAPTGQVMDFTRHIPLTTPGEDDVQMERLGVVIAKALAEALAPLLARLVPAPPAAAAPPPPPPPAARK
jgi:hypothetical protein